MCRPRWEFSVLYNWPTRSGGQRTGRKATYSRIGLLRSYGNLQAYWTTTKLWKLTVVLDYYEAMETNSRIGLLRSYGNLQWYWTTVKRWKLTVVLEYREAMELYRLSGPLQNDVCVSGSTGWEIRLSPRVTSVLSSKSGTLPDWCPMHIRERVLVMHFWGEILL
jgi:hypothetical protein